ncbi:MAG: O-antigen ligase family protein [Clostridia bacterium]|nr:O-antigen ligase family protein [Clostridia bacterium]
MLRDELRELSKERKINRFAIISLCIYFLFTYVGFIIPYVQSVFLYLSALLAFLLIIVNKRFKINSYLIWYAAFTFMALISCLFLDDVASIFNSVYNLVIVIVFAFSLFSIINKQRYIDWLFVLSEVGSFVLLLYLLLTDSFFFSDTGERLGQTLTGNANTFASIYMFAACISVYFIIRFKDKKKRITFLVVFILQMLTLVLSAGRKFFLIPLLLLYIMLVMNKDKNGKRHYIKYTVIAVCIATALYFMLTKIQFFYETIGVRFEEMLSYYFGGADSADFSTMEREKMRRAAIELWEQRPVFGHGLDAFTSIAGFGTYSHSNFTELLCNHGLVGFLLYYSFFAVSIVRIVRLRYSLDKNFLLGMIICILIFDFGAVTYNGFFFQMMIILIVCMLEFKVKEERLLTPTEELK